MTASALHFALLLASSLVGTAAHEVERQLGARIVLALMRTAARTHRPERCPVPSDHPEAELAPVPRLAPEALVVRLPSRLASLGFFPFAGWAAVAHRNESAVAVADGG